MSGEFSPSPATLTTAEQAQFAEIADRSDMVDVAGMKTLLETPTPFGRAWDSAQNLNPDAAPYEVYRIAQQDETQRFEQLVEAQPAVGPAMNEVRKSVYGGRTGTYGIDSISNLNHHDIVDQVPNPAELAERIAGIERMNEEYENQHPGSIQEMLEAELEAAQQDGKPAAIRQVEARMAYNNRAQRRTAHEGILQELYGDRWSTYKDAVGVENFDQWLDQWNTRQAAEASAGTETGSSAMASSPDITPTPSKETGGPIPSPDATPPPDATPTPDAEPAPTTLTGPERTHLLRNTEVQASLRDRVLKVAHESVADERWLARRYAFDFDARGDATPRVVNGNFVRLDGTSESPATVVRSLLEFNAQTRNPDTGEVEVDQAQVTDNLDFVLLHDWNTIQRRRTNTEPTEPDTEPAQPETQETARDPLRLRVRAGIGHTAMAAVGIFERTRRSLYDAVTSGTRGSARTARRAARAARNAAYSAARVARGF